MLLNNNKQRNLAKHCIYHTIQYNTIQYIMKQWVTMIQTKSKGKQKKQKYIPFLILKAFYEF